MPFLVIAGIACTLATMMLVTWALPEFTTHPLIVNSVIGLIVATLVLFYFLSAASIIKRRATNERKRLLKGEEIIHRSRMHKLPFIVACSLSGVCSLVFFSLSMALLASGSSAHIDSGTSRFIDPNGQERQIAIHASIPYWPWPLIGCLLFAYPALDLWQRWKWTSRIITNFRYFNVREQSALFPWITQRNDTTPLDQFADADYDSGVFGGIFGWGNIDWERWLGKNTDQTKEFRIPLVPNAQDFANLLAEICPRLKSKMSFVESTLDSEDTDEYVPKDGDKTN